MSSSTTVSEEDIAVMERIKAWMSPDVWERLVRAIVHDQCHNLDPIVGPKEFAAGCAEYQRKLFGDLNEHPDEEAKNSLPPYR